jgi:hypothetical protein
MKHALITDKHLEFARQLEAELRDDVNYCNTAQLIADFEAEIASNLKADTKKCKRKAAR